MAGDVSINVSPEVVRPIIEAKIQAAIVAELERDKNLVSKMVAAALNIKVDSEGKPGRGYGGEIPYIEFLCRQAIHNAAQGAMKEYLAENADMLKQAVKEQLGKHGEDLAAAFVNGLVNAVESKWKFQCDVKFGTLRDY